MSNINEYKKDIENPRDLGDLLPCKRCGMKPSYMSSLHGYSYLWCRCHQPIGSADNKDLFNRWNIANKKGEENKVEPDTVMNDVEATLKEKVSGKRIYKCEPIEFCADPLPVEPKKHKTLFSLARNKVIMKPCFNPEEQLIEEMAELTQAICKMKRKNSIANYENFKEELSDVLFCIFCIMFKRSITKKSLFKIANKKTKDRFPEELE